MTAIVIGFQTRGQEIRRYSSHLHAPHRPAKISVAVPEEEPPVLLISCSKSVCADARREQFVRCLVSCGGANTANLAALPHEMLEKHAGALCALAVRMTTAFADVDALTEKIIGCAIEVHRILGPGLLESVYRECLMIEMRRQGLRVEGERCLGFDYKGQRISGALKIDLLVSDLL